jgi:hypothetical protein
VFDVIIATIYNKFDFAGIYAYTIIMSISIGIAYFISVYHKTKNVKISIVFTLGVEYFARAVFVARAQEISFLIFILEFLFIQKLLETNKKRYAVLLIILPILLANFHSSVYPVYFVFYLPYFAEFVLHKILTAFGKKTRKIKIEKEENIKTLFIVFVISLFTGLCTTTGLAPYTDMFKVMFGVSKQFIGELTSSTWENNKVFYKIFIVAILLIVAGKHEVKITDIFYILGFSAMTIVTYRCFYFFLFISSTSIAKIYIDFLKANDIKLENKYIKFELYFVLAMLYILVLTGNVFRIQKQDYVENDDYPIEACKYIIENIDTENMRIYNHFNFGSYLEFSGIKAFIDSRSGMFCEEFNPGCTILKDWCAVHNDEKTCKEILEKYDINYVIAQKTENITKELDLDKDWAIIYEDEYWNLYEKK